MTLPAAIPQEQATITTAYMAERLPGYIWQDRKTRQLLGVLSCTECGWLTLITPGGARSEMGISDVTNRLERVAIYSLRAVRSLELDAGGEFPIHRWTWRVGHGELLTRLELERMKAAA